MFGRGGGTINRKITYTTLLALCVMFSALPFAGAADTQNIQNNNINTCLNQSNVGTNAVTDNGLKIGATGNQVIELQKWLKNQGYYTGAIDESLGEYTQQAVKLFQTDANITIDGWVSTQTENAMKTLTGTNPITNNNNTKTTTAKNTANSAANQTTTTTAKAATSTKNTTATISTSAKTNTTSSTITAAKAKVTSTTSKQTISGWFEPTGAFDSGYAYKWYYVTWLNYDPSSGQWGVLEYNPKGADGGELTSSVTGVDYDGVSGYEKEYSPRWQLTKA